MIFQKITPEAQTLLGTLEGLKLKAYLDGAGIWTIGRGHTRFVFPGMVITTERAEELFLEDQAETIALVNQVIGDIPWTENQFSAFVLFAYNVKGWPDRPLTQHVKRLDIEGCKAHWLLYDKDTVNGVKEFVAGLLARRQAELKLFLS